MPVYPAQRYGLVVSARQLERGRSEWKKEEEKKEEEKKKKKKKKRGFDEVFLFRVRG